MIRQRRNHQSAMRGIALLLCAGAVAISAAQEQKKAPAPPPGGTLKPAIYASPPYPPNEVDLKAAYCRPVIAASIAEHQRAASGKLPPNLQNTAKDRHTAAIERARRLEFYLLPRLNTLQSTGLLDAQGRGYTDVASFAEVARACDAKCIGLADAASACRQRCGEGNESAKRMRGCDDISWLPLKDP